MKTTYKGIKELFTKMPHSGKVEWIGIRSEKRAELTPITEVMIDIKQGLIGDHYKGKSGKRQVTLIQKEHLDVVAKLLRQEKIDPLLTRRNIVVSGINIHALKGQQFRIGNKVVLEGTGDCHPCSRMETNLGEGGYNAMRGHGGLTAKVISEGVIKQGDAVIFLESNNK